jgi:hypothetical protein
MQGEFAVKEPLPAGTDTATQISNPQHGCNPQQSRLGVWNMAVRWITSSSGYCTEIMQGDRDMAYGSDFKQPGLPEALSTSCGSIRPYHEHPDFADNGDPEVLHIHITMLARLTSKWAIQARFRSRTCNCRDSGQHSSNATCPASFC